MLLSFSTEFELDDPRYNDIQSPQPELLYYGSPEDQETPLHQLQERNEEMTALPYDIRGPHMYSSIPLLCQPH